MAYRRKDEGGRVIGFKDGQPVYKKVNRGERGEGRTRTGGRGYMKDGERFPRAGGEAESSDRRVYKGRDGSSGFESRQGSRPYRSEGERRENREDGRERRYTREGGETGYRDQGRDGFRENRYAREGGETGPRTRGSYREDGYERREYREGGREPYGSRRYDREGGRTGNREDRPRFADERLQRKSDEMQALRPPRERKQYNNMKDLPRDVEPQAEEELPNIIMGRNPVKEAIKAGRSIDRILVTSEHDGSLNEILDLAYGAKLVVRNVDRSRLDEICMPFGHNGRPGNHQGIIAYVPEAQYCELSDILDYAKEKGESPFVVLLDGIEDPHNLGSIIRSAECAGAHGIVIPKRRSASVTAAVVKTSAGATEHMRIAKVVNLAVAIERLKEAGVWVAAADMGGEPMTSADLKGPFALVVGAEGAGVSRLVKEKCDYTVSVPLKGQMESLNASVAAAVIMFEKVRQDSLQ